VAVSQADRDAEPYRSTVRVAEKATAGNDSMGSFLSGRIDEKSEERALLLDEIEPANEVVRREVSGLVLLLRGLFVSDSTLARIAAICEQHRGNQSLHLDVEEEGHVHRVRCDASIQVSDALLDEFALVVGPENMSFTRR
jgi:hypothetical protein